MGTEDGNNIEPMVGQGRVTRLSSEDFAEFSIVPFVGLDKIPNGSLRVRGHIGGKVRVFGGDGWKRGRAGSTSHR